MKRVGYDETGSIIATTVCCAIGSIIAAFLTDMPFIVAPPTSVSIFLAVSMQQQGLVKDAGTSQCYGDKTNFPSYVEVLDYF
jgi:xanthine/uracil/vitamin C permease (AzgA family)